MTSRHTNPAIYAGLAGAAAWAAPTCASALTVLGTDVPISEPALSFIAGCLAGAVVASGTSLAINHAVNSRREREAAEQALAAHARSAKAARNRDAVKRLEEREAYLAARAAQEKGAAHVAYPEAAGQQQRPQQQRPQQARPQVAQQPAPQGSLQQQMAARAAAQQAAQRAAQQGAHMTPAQRAQAAVQHHNVNTPAERAQQAPAELAARAAEAAREAAIAEAQLKVRAAQAKAEQARKAAEAAQNAAAHQADVYAARQAAAFAAQQAAYVAQGMHVPGMQGGLNHGEPETGSAAQKASPAQRPYEEQRHEAPRATAETGRPRHAARSTVRADATGTWDKTGDIRVQAAPAAPRAKAQKQGPAQAAPQQGKPRYTVAAHYGSASTDPGVSAAWEAWQASAGNSNAGADYLDVAEEYVNRITLKDRMAQRAKGVAGVLSERLGASKMEGLPVIARADGSVGDVGESWWNDAMGEDVRAVADGATGLRGVEESMLDNSAVLFTAQTREQAQAARDRWQAQAQATQAKRYSQQERPQRRPQARPAQPAQQTGEVAYTPRTDRAAIAGRLADPKVVFPDQTHHWSDEQQDLWNVALNALDERTKEQVAMAAANSSAVSFTTDFSTLDEPDHMEPATQFMSFKPQGGKPEVVDAESYVDMLLDQELAKSDSEAVRKLAQHDVHEYFRVVDGGTADIAPKPAPAPHHVAL